VTTSDAGPSCSAATCAGCCQDGICQSGTTVAACGTSGNQCAVCMPGTTCLNGVCQRRGPAGAACTSTNDCEPPTGSVCLSWPGGYCSYACTSMTTTCGLWQSCPGVCPSGAACMGTGTGLSICMATCPGPQSGQSTCRAGYVCAALGAASSFGICRPACTTNNFGCQGVGTCNVLTGYCQ